MQIIKNKKTKKTTRLKIGRRDKDIIKAIGTGIGLAALIATLIVTPNLPVALASFFKKQGRAKLKGNLDKLHNKNLVSFNGSKVRLTAKGLRLQKIIKLEETSLKKPKEWDSYWRLVSYDVPEADRSSRDYFRETIEKWGFRKVQKSLWAYPYHCKEEIAVLADSLNITSHVIYMTTDEMPKEDYWQKYFEL